MPMQIKICIQFPENNLSKMELINFATTIIIPVYNAYEDTKKCVESVIQHTDHKHPILIVDDASTDLRIKKLLGEFSLTQSHISVVENFDNLGFVKTCNLAFSASDGSTDVVLLNSDTVVTPNWLDKLINAAYSEKNVATVTPLTNNGTICSVPIWLESNDIPAGHTIISFASLIENISLKEYPQIPTAVGFCMYIKRDVLNKVGYFDAVNFGRGYGEENDFCCRATNSGYIHIIDDSTFVYHSGSKSFGAQKLKLIEENSNTLTKLHPNYFPSVEKFIAEKSIQRIINNIELNLFLIKVIKLSPICFILHKSIEISTDSQLGGTEYHCAALIEELRDTQPIYTLHFDKYKSAISLTIFYQQEKKYFDFPFNKSLGNSYLSQDDIFSKLFADIIRHFRPAIIHVHHLMGLSIRDILSVLLQENIPYMVSIHDYYLICPSYNLIDYNQSFCYEHKNDSYCQECSHKLLGESYDLKNKWSEICEELLEHAQLVITPSVSTASYIKREYQYTKTKNNIKVIRHGVFKEDFIKKVSTLRSISQAESANIDLSLLKIGFVGSINVDKGAREIIDLVKIVNEDSLLKHKFEFSFFGRFSEDIPMNSPNISITNEYDNQDLYDLLKDVDVVIFPTKCAETYCLTADEVIMCGIPILSSPVGAVAERIQLFDVGWISPSSSPEDLLNTLLLIVNDPVNFEKIKNNTQKYPIVSYEAMSSLYLQEYQYILSNIVETGIEKVINNTFFLTNKDIFEAHQQRQRIKQSRSSLLFLKKTKPFQFLKKKSPWVWKLLKMILLRNN
jgi:GT2 family glycosyltransferase/glycosyltransferase involved in cell wall biosynthesis